MAFITALPDLLKSLLSKGEIDSVDRLIRESDQATERKLEEERKAKGPAVAALAAAQVASDVEKRAKEAEALSKIAKAAAKAATKRAKHYRKEASKAASRASAAEVDAAAKAAEAIRVSQTAAVDEAQAIISSHQKTPEP
jgi:septal ring factor EnvC (AmiA/AmiB activator)